MSRTVPRAGVLLVGLIAVSTVVRALVALDRPTPLYYPDEYIYTALARSIAHTGLPRIRGEVPHFPALITPYLMAPAWLIHNLDAAYRLALAWGSFWFSLAAIPAYALARRLGVSERGALLVALLSLLLPDAVFTTDLMSEPYSYPVFLATAVVAVDTLAAPSRRRQAVLLLLMLALCLLRVQFVVVPAAYLVAGLAYSRCSVNTLLRRQWLVAAGLGLGVVATLAVGTNRLVGYYTQDSPSIHYTATGLARWYGLNLFVLAVAAGWVVVPGAISGLLRLWRGDAKQRAFARLSVPMIAAFVAVAAPFGITQNRVYERYVFYVVPLIVAAFVWAVESLPRDRLYSLIGYSAAALAILVPIASGLRGTDDDMSPTLLGLGTLFGSGNVGTLIWATGLALTAAVTGLRIGGRLLTPMLAVVIVAAVGAAGTGSLLGFGTALGARLNMSPEIPRLDAPPRTALITSQLSNKFLLMKTLFWNPNISRVLSIGGNGSPDGFASTSVRLAPGAGLVDDHGRPITGPFAVDSDTVADPGAPATAVLQRSPTTIVFGLNRIDGYFETAGSLSAEAGRKPVVVNLRMRSVSGSKGMSVDCTHSRRVVTVGARSTNVSIRVPAHSVETCRIALVRGLPITHRRRTVSVQAVVSRR